MDKLVMVLVDACRYDAALRNFGMLEHLTDYGQCARYKVKGELPSLSRPMYATLMTGLPACSHGVYCNEMDLQPDAPSVFSLCRAAGGVTAAAAWKWMAQLFARPGFSLNADRFQIGTDAAIENGIYYEDDDYPDQYVLADGEYMRRAYHPDFILYHTMAVDNAGHLYGADSLQYEQAVSNISRLLSPLVPQWLAEGYQVVVTADHGMNEHHLHGGTTDGQRDVPLYILSPKVMPGRYEDGCLSELTIAPLLCRLLDIAPSEQMREVIGVQFAEKI